MSLQPSTVEKTAVEALTDIYSIFFVKVFHGLLEHQAEKGAEQSWSQNTTLVHTIDTGGEFREINVLVFMQLDDHTEKIWWTAEALHDKPKTFSAHSNALVKSMNVTYSPLFFSRHFS